MLLKNCQINISLWAGPLFLASFLGSDSLPDFELIDLAKGRRLKKDLSDKIFWKRGTYQFRGDPKDVNYVNPVLGFLPEDIRWLQGGLDDDVFWTSSSRMPEEWSKWQNITFPPRRPDQSPRYGLFPDFKYWVHILFKNVPEEISRNLIHDLTSRLERAHEFAFKRRRDSYPGLMSPNGQEKVLRTSAEAVEDTGGDRHTLGPNSEVREKRSTNGVDVTMLKLSKETENEVEAIYVLRRDGKPVLSKSAVLELNDLTENEMDVIFSPYSVARLTSERRQAVVEEIPEPRHSLVLPLVIVGTVASLVLVLAIFLYRYKKRAQDIEERHWRDQEAPGSLERKQISKDRSSRRVVLESGEPMSSGMRAYDEQAARVHVGLDEEMDKYCPETSQDSEDALIPAKEVPKRPRVPPRSKRVGIENARIKRQTIPDDSVDDTDVIVDDHSRSTKSKQERPKSSYRGAIISDDVPSSSTTAVKPELRDRALQIEPDARDVACESAYDLVAEPDGEEGILRMKQRFHRMLDEAFDAFSPSDVPDGKLTFARVEVYENESEKPPPLPEKRAKSADTRATFERPEKARPISALLRAGDLKPNDSNVLSIAVPPKPAWGTHSDQRFDVDVQASSSQFAKGRKQAPPPSPEPFEIIIGSGLRSYEPVDPESGLRMNDPAVTVIKAIKEELKRFSGPTISPTTHEYVHQNRDKRVKK